MASPRACAAVDWDAPLPRIRLGQQNFSYLGAWQDLRQANEQSSNISVFRGALQRLRRGWNLLRGTAHRLKSHRPLPTLKQ